MKLAIVFTLALLSANAFASGPYFENAEKAPITHGTLIFNSPELNSLGKGQYIGEVVVQKTAGGFEVAPMIYSCSWNDEDDSLGCKYLRYDAKKAKSYKECEVFNNDYFNCY